LASFLQSPAAAPRTVFIELTSHCNMHCTFCPSDLLRRKKGTISIDTIRSFLADLHALGMRPPVLLNVLGEPLLHKSLFGILDLLEQEGHQATLITNMILLADKAVRREILRHPRLTLALSLQTVTETAFRMRGYPRIRFKDFFRIVYEAAEEKFHAGSGTRLEIHVASNYVMAHDPSIQADFPLDFWPNFRDEAEERRWIGRTLRRLESFGRRLRKRYPQAFENERIRTEALYKDHIGTRIAVSRSTLPPDFHRFKDDVFWGFMALPNVFLVFKSLELWTRDEAFLRSIVPAGTFIHVEENPGPWPCPMAESFGILANGDYVLCCLDYEGEMELGNIKTTPPSGILESERRARIRADAMTEPLCRRCKGTLFLLDTKLLSTDEPPVDMFGGGGGPFEPGLHGRGGRWTSGEAWAYVYARLSARRLRIRFFTELADGTTATLEIQSFREAGKTFEVERSVSFPLRKERLDEIAVDFNFRPGVFYRLILRSPVFVPDDLRRNGDKRRLGLGVHDVLLQA